MRMMGGKSEAERLVARQRFFDRQLDFYQNAPPVAGYTAAEHANLMVAWFFDGCEMEIHIP
jgi:hypothetical protein